MFFALRRKPLHIGADNARAIVIFDIMEFVRRLVLVFRQTGLDFFLVKTLQ